MAAASFLADTSDPVRSAPPALLGFTPVPAGDADELVLPKGYTAAVLIPWGTPLRSGGPAWRPDDSNTAGEQAEQVGTHHDGMHLFETRPGRGLLVLNYAYTDRTLVYADGHAEMTAAKVARAWPHLV